MTGRKKSKADESHVEQCKQSLQSQREQSVRLFIRDLKLLSRTRLFVLVVNFSFSQYYQNRSGRRVEYHQLHARSWEEGLANHPPHIHLLWLQNLILTTSPPSAVVQASGPWVQRHMHSLSAVVGHLRQSHLDKRFRPNFLSPSCRHFPCVFHHNPGQEEDLLYATPSDLFGHGPCVGDLVRTALLRIE